MVVFSGAGRVTAVAGPSAVAGAAVASRGRAARASAGRPRRSNFVITVRVVAGPTARPGENRPVHHPGGRPRSPEKRHSTRTRFVDRELLGDLAERSGLTVEQVAALATDLVSKDAAAVYP